jgi:hypothetical protein
MRIRIPALLGCCVAALAAAACHSDKNGELPTSPSTDSTGSATSSTGLNITVDSGIIGDTVLVHTVVPISVHVKQNGTPVPGTTVTWTVASGGGLVSAATSTTDATGLATVTWTIGDTARTNGLSAAITGASVGVTVTAIGGAPIALAKISPDSDAVVAGAALSLVARVTDKFGNPASDVVVNWSATGGSLSAPNSKTTLSGNAGVNFVTGATASSYLVTASVPGIGSVSFRVVGL